jgi:predicted DNA-binding transcriptional regulator YafY
MSSYAKGRKGRNCALVRALAVWQALREKRQTLHDLAARYAVHPRTIRRDIYALEAAGIPVLHTPESDHGSKGLWWIS